MFPSASPRGTLRVSGKQNSLFPLGPVIKCLLEHLSRLIVFCFAFHVRNLTFNTSGSSKRQLKNSGFGVLDYFILFIMRLKSSFNMYGPRLL